MIWFDDAKNTVLASKECEKILSFYISACSTNWQAIGESEDDILDSLIVYRTDWSNLVIDNNFFFKFQGSNARLLFELFLHSIIVKLLRAMKDINKVTIHPLRFVKGVVHVYII